MYASHFFFSPGLSPTSSSHSCTSPNCLAHNFGYVLWPFRLFRVLFRPVNASLWFIRRNVMCIRCGTARTMGGSPYSTRATPFPPPHHASPRFGSRSPTVPSPSSVVPLSEVKTMSRPSAPCYPILTPSGKALSAGGRVRNISTDPLAPCIMYWPDNEPLPDNGQVRPLGSAATQVRTSHCLSICCDPLRDFSSSHPLSTLATRVPPKNSRVIGIAEHAITSTGGVEKFVKRVTHVS